jgi:hypothetical protein
MQERDESNRGGDGINNGRKQREPYLLHDNGAHGPVPVQPFRVEFLAPALPEEPVKQAGQQQIARRDYCSERCRYAEKL